MGLDFLIMTEVVAVFCDFYCRKIPNPLIVTGLFMGLSWQWCMTGIPGVLFFAKGAGLAFLMLAILHWFRMLGAGDIKLLMVCGGFMGPEKVMKVIAISFLAAAVISVFLIMRRRGMIWRFQYLYRYLMARLAKKEWEPYITAKEEEGYLHFSLPVLVGTVAVILSEYLL